MIRNKFKSAGYPIRFVNSAIHAFTAVQANEDIEFIITPWLFEIKKKISHVEHPIVSRMKAHLNNLLKSLISLLMICLMCK